MQRSFVALALLVGLGLGASQPSEAGDQTAASPMALVVSGSYSSNWGDVTLRQNGNRVTGSYVFRNGTLEGTMEGNLLRYTWHEGQTTGHGVFVLATDRELIGTWGVGEDDLSGGGWRLTPAKQTAALAQ